MPSARQALRPERLLAVLAYGVLLLLLALVFVIFRPFLIPLAWAAVLAVLCSPWTGRLRARWGRTGAAGAGTAGVTLILIVPALLLMVLFVAEGAQAAGNLQDAIAAGRFHWINRVWGWLTERSGATGSDLPALLRDSAAQIGTFLAAQLGTVVRNIAIFLFELFVTLFALFYFIRDGEAIVNGLLDALPFDRAICDQILMEARQLIHATVRVGLFLALLQGLVGGLAFAIVRIPTPLFWGMAMAFLALLPVVGTWPIWLPAVVWLYAAGHGVRATLLLIICAVMVGAVDYFLRPALLSGDARLNGLLVFIGVLGGVAAFGMLGVVLGPLVLATAMSVWDVYARRERRAAGPEALLS